MTWRAGEVDVICPKCGAPVHTEVFVESVEVLPAHGVGKIAVNLSPRVVVNHVCQLLVDR